MPSPCCSARRVGRDPGAERTAPAATAARPARGRHEVVVVDDGSTDDTAAVARLHGATVVSASDRPVGWAGKTWALQCGATAARGRWIVHLDADVRPDPSLPDIVVDHAERHRLDLVSVATSAVLPQPARWLHASMLATLVYRFGGPGGARPGRELLNGQVIAARRELLIGPDGWSAVADHVTEDVALGRHLSRSGRRVALVDGLDLATVEADSFAEVWSGWGRSIGVPGATPTWHTVVDVAAMAATMPLPLARAVTGRADLLDALLLSIRWGTALGVSSAYRPAGPSVWAAPLADPLALAAVVRSSAQRTVTWRGRRLPVPRRSSPGRSAVRRTT
ncbi:MAG: glycosyltransferase family 2 protein [Ilumatobacteraceae bacterium]